MLKKKKILFLIAGVMLLSVSSVFAKDFLDVSKTHWGYEAISKTTELGITNGYPDGSFLPEGKVTRAEFSKMLVEGLNLTGKSKLEFEDVSEEFWGYEHIQIASKYLEGEVSGEEIYYNPNAPAIREDIAVAIVKAMKLQNKSYPETKIDKFLDSGDISDEAKKYVVIVAESDLMVGNADGTFNPQGTLTRAEASQLILNLLEYKEEHKKKSSGSSSNNSSSVTPEAVTYEYEWKDVEGSVIGQGKLYIKNSKGEYVNGTLKLTTLSGATITENVTADGSDNIYIKSAIDSIEIENIL